MKNPFAPPDESSATTQRSGSILARFAALWAVLLFTFLVYGLVTIHPPLLRHYYQTSQHPHASTSAEDSAESKPFLSEVLPAATSVQAEAPTASVAVPHTDSQIDGPTATIDAGVIVGTTTSFPTATASVNKFLGIPFASPPVRFSPAKLPQKFADILHTKTWGPACLQQFRYPEAVHNFTKAIYDSTEPQESEDCLYLNVYAPSTPPPADGRTVMFWIYGGAFQFGHASSPYYDGSKFASDEDVIVVSANYRTNVFGFARSPELPLDQQNLGFLDQRLALNWVQRNIAAFGGSPHKVTIFGESAGAFSIDALLTSFPANSTPPFRGAILQSGQYSFKQLAEIDSVSNWHNLSAQFNCPGIFESNLTCLRAVDAREIREYIEINSLAFDPVHDGFTLVENPAQKRQSGDIAKIPVLGGTNAQDGRIFALAYSNFTELAETTLGDYSDQLPQIEEAYAQNTTGIGPSSFDQIAQIFTEYIFQCPQALWANATAANGIPTWRYMYNASFTNTQGFPGGGSYHASEIPIIFGTYLPNAVTTQEEALSSSMRAAWARFAKNPLAGPGWNAVSTGTAASIMNGATEMAEGGLYQTGETIESGSWNLGLFGDRLGARTSGVTVIEQHEVDFRCHFFTPIYNHLTKL